MLAASPAQISQIRRYTRVRLVGLLVACSDDWSNGCLLDLVCRGRRRRRCVVVRGWSWQPQQGSPSGSQVQIELHIGTFGTVDEHNLNLEGVGKGQARRGGGGAGAHTVDGGAEPFGLLYSAISTANLKNNNNNMKLSMPWPGYCSCPSPSPLSPSLSLSLSHSLCCCLSLFLSVSLSVCCWSKGLLCSCCSSTVFRLLCLLYDNVLSPSPLPPLPCLPLTLSQFSVVFLVILRHSVGIVVVLGRLPVDDYYVCLNSMHVPALKLICIEYD